MEFDPNLSRRQLLVGGGLSVAGGFAGTALFAPRWLPDPLTDPLISLYPEPSAVVWEPTISQTHADRALAYFEKTVSKAKTLHSKVDNERTGPIPEMVESELRHKPDGGWLENAKSASNPRMRLHYVQEGLVWPGRSIGAAKIALGTAELSTLGTRGKKLHSRALELLEDHRTYEVARPGRDLGYLWYLEQEIAHARSDASFNLAHVNDRNEAIMTAWGRILTAKQRLRTTRYYRKLYVERRGDHHHSYESVLNDAVATFRTDLSAFPTKQEKRASIDEQLDGFFRDDPLAAAKRILLDLCFKTQVAFFEPGDYRSGHTIQHVVALVEELLARRAYEPVLKSLNVTAEDTRFDAGRAFRAKQSAVRTVNRVRDEYDSPLARLLQREAVRLLGRGTLTISSDTQDGRPVWYKRLEAACLYLVCEQMLQDVGEYLELLLQDKERGQNSTVTPTRSPSFGGLF